MVFFPMHYIGIAGFPRRYYSWSNFEFANSFTDLNMFVSVAAILTFVAQFALQHSITLDIAGISSKVLCVDLLDQLFKFLLLDIGVTGTMIAGSFDYAVQILLTPSFECSSSDLTEDLPFPFGK